MRATPRPRWRGPRNLLGGAAALAAILAIAVVVGLFWPPVSSLSGYARAVDGDTLRLADTRIRLVGLDAVELDQTCTESSGVTWDCGREARAFLAGLVDGQTTTCAPDGRDRYRRVLARCKTAGSDLGTQLVRAGWAVAEIEYGVALAEARLNGRGIWSGSFDDPADWRRRHGAQTSDFWTWLMGLLGR